MAVSAPNAPGLVEPPASILAGVGSVDQQVNLALARGDLDLLRAVDQRPAAGFQAEPVERLLPERRFDPLAQVSRDVDRAGLEGTGEGGLELALGIGFIERLAADADPGSPARGAGANVGRDLALRAKREPDQLVSRGGPPGEDAGPFGLMPVATIIVRPERSRTAAKSKDGRGCADPSTSRLRRYAQDERE